MTLLPQLEHIVQSLIWYECIKYVKFKVHREKYKNKFMNLNFGLGFEIKVLIAYKFVYKNQTLNQVIMASEFC